MGPLDDKLTFTPIDRSRVLPFAVRESNLLQHIFKRSEGLANAFPQVLLGPGDDCAIVSASPRTLLKVDQLIEGVHFVRGTAARDIAYKAIARTVSDIAAMAGSPRASLAACILPLEWSTTDSNELFDHAARVAKEFGCPLVGGDISSHVAIGQPLSITIMIMGDAHAHVAPLRSAAVPGDSVYITGALGGSFGHEGMGRHLRFIPRLAEGVFLADHLGQNLHAMMDISDGLGIDSARIAKASGVSIVIESGAVPVHPDAAGQGILAAMSDGEDYELLFTSDAQVPPACPTTGTPLTRIGRVEAGSGAWLVEPDGRRIDISARGYDHR